MQLFIEIATDYYLTAFRNRLMSVPVALCDLSVVVDGDRILADRIEYGTPSIISPSQIAMPITAHLTTDAALQTASGVAPPVEILAVTLTLKLQLSAATSSPAPGKASLSFTVAYAGFIPPDTLPPGVSAESLSSIVDGVGAGLRSTVQTDISKLNEAADQPRDATPAAAVGLSAVTQSFGLLLDWGGPGPITTTAIMNGQLPGNTRLFPDENLSLLLSTDMVTRPLEDSIRSGFTGDLRIDSDLTPQWQWRADSDTAAVHYGFQATAVNACKLPIVGGLVDIGLDITVDATVSVPSRNTLRTDGSFDYSKHPGDVIECALIVGSLEGLIGAILGFVSGGPVGAAVGGVVGLAMGTVGVIILANAHGAPSPTLKPNCTSGDKTFSCTNDLSSIRFGGTPISIQRLAGLLNGALHLRASLPPPLPAPQPAISNITIGEWETGVYGSCSKGFRVGSSRTVHFDFDPPSAGDKAAVRICPPMILGQPVSLSDRLYVAETMQDNAARQAEITAFFNQVQAATYPCTLRVQTSAGTRQFPLGLPPILEEQELQRLTLLAGAADVNCRMLVAQRFDIRWLIDPPDLRVVDPDRVFHLWEIAVTEVEPGIGVSLHATAGGEEIATAVPDQAGIAEFGALLTPTPRADVSLRLSADAGSPPLVYYAQTTLLHEASFTVADPVTEVHLTRLGGEEVAALRQPGGWTLVSLTSPTVPRFLAAGPATAIAQLGLRLPASDEDGDVTVALEPRPELRTGLGLSGVTTAVQIGNRLAVRRADVVELHALSELSRPTLLASFPANSRDVFRAEGTIPGNRVFLRNRGGGGEVVSLDAINGAPAVLARYQRDPWFLNFARNAAHAVRVVGEQEVAVYSVLGFARANTSVQGRDVAAE